MRLRFLALLMGALILAGCTSTQNSATSTVTLPAAAANPLEPSATAGPTATPFPPEIQALIDQLEDYLLEVKVILDLYGRPDQSQTALDRSLRALVPTVEALTADLRERGVPVPDAPLPPTPALNPVAEVFDVGMVTADRVQLAATYYAPAAAAAPGVALLHRVDGSRSDWDALARQLQAAGVGVLALDMRGHGSSQGAKEYAAMTNDAAVAIAYLRSREELDPNHLLLIGASVGANIALTYAAADPTVAAVALLSPGEVYRGVSTLPALAQYGDRPLFIAASSEDGYAIASAQKIDAAAVGPHELLILEQQGHGTAMLGRGNGLEEALLRWLAETTLR